MLSSIEEIYNQFLNFFPTRIHGLVSVVLAVLLVYGVYKVIKKQFIYLILLAVLLPASVPILKSVWNGVWGLLKFLLTKR